MSLHVLRYLRKSALSSLAQATRIEKDGDNVIGPHLVRAHRGDAHMLNTAAQIVTRHLCLKYWYVDSGGWMVVEATSKAKARTMGVAEFGRGNVRDVRLATPAEVKTYRDQKGEITMEDDL